MANIFFVIARIYRNQVKCNYLRNEKPFPIFLLHFLDLNQLLNILKQKILVYFANCALPKTWLDKCVKSPVSEHRSTVNTLNDAKDC